MEKEKRFLTAEEAISILPDGEYVHTTYQTGFVFVGADWDREDIIDKIRNSEKREITGPNARAKGHGLALYPQGAKFQSDILFVETDMKRLEELEGKHDKNP